MPPGSGDLEVRYTALSFVNSQAVRFKYKLEGFDKDWVDVGPRRAAYYTNLPPATYSFRVLAANSDGVWNETGASIAFRLQPHYYQTTWFLGLVLLVCSGAALTDLSAAGPAGAAVVSASSCASSRSARAICSRK